MLRAVAEAGGKLEPKIDPMREMGYYYPSLASVTKPDKELVELLDQLSEEGALGRRLVHVLLVCPKDGSTHVRPALVCPSCSSEDLSKAKLVEHLPCGHIGPEATFETGSGLVCPKCRRELKLLGRDYRKPSDFYLCGRCHEVAFSPSVSAHCLSCEHIFAPQEASRSPVYRYEVGDEAATLRALQPVQEIAAFLKGQGFDVRTHHRIPGRSGAEHEVDILAEHPDGPPDGEVVIAVAAQVPEVPAERAVELYGKAMDIGARVAILLAVPKLSEGGKRYAAFHRIHYFEAPDVMQGLKPFLEALDRVIPKPRG